MESGFHECLELLRDDALQTVTCDKFYGTQQFFSSRLLCLKAGGMWWMHCLKTTKTLF